jgi:hypothetical protein
MSRRQSGTGTPPLAERNPANVGAKGSNPVARTSSLVFPQARRCERPSSRRPLQPGFHLPPRGFVDGGKELDLPAPPTVPRSTRWIRYDVLPSGKTSPCILSTANPS